MKVAKPAAALLISVFTMAASRDEPPATPPIAMPEKAATPLSNPDSWVTPDDYPVAALRENRVGSTWFRLEIDQNGMPAACTITESSGSGDLDETTCALVTTRARFSPALDHQGHATSGTYASAVRWVIPTVPQPVTSGVIVMSGLLGGDGTFSDCRIERVEGTPAKSLVVGPTSCAKIHFENARPVANSTGEPVARRIRRSMMVEILPP